MGAEMLFPALDHGLEHATDDLHLDVSGIQMRFPIAIVTHNLVGTYLRVLSLTTAPDNIGGLIPKRVRRSGGWVPRCRDAPRPRGKDQRREMLPTQDRPAARPWAVRALRRGATISGPVCSMASSRLTSAASQRARLAILRRNPGAAVRRTLDLARTQGNEDAWGLIAGNRSAAEYERLVCNRQDGHRARYTRLR